MAFFKGGDRRVTTVRCRNENGPLAHASSREKLDTSGIEAKGRILLSTAVGRLIAQRAKAAGVTQVCFDRGGYLYHGRVKALADGARAGGLDF